MSEEPRDDLEAMFAADEAGIRDDGFSARVRDEVARSQRLRRFAVYGAGMAGFGVAVGGVSELASDFPALTNWILPAQAAAEGAASSGLMDMFASMSSGDTGVWAVALAGALGLTFFVASAVMQER